MAKTKKNRYKRIVLKISGEALAWKEGYGINADTIESIASDIKFLLKDKLQVGIVVGGGNFFRGARNNSNISRVAGDRIGMVSTMLNAIAIEDVFIRLKVPVRIMSPLPIAGLVEQYNYRKAGEYLDQGFVVVFSGGIGNPLVTTDTTLCMRGIELNADLLLKATNVDGVYSSDPKKNSRAKFYSHLTYNEALAKKLEVMDLTAFTLGRDHKMKLQIFNMNKKGALLRAVRGLKEGTLVE